LRRRVLFVELVALERRGEIRLSHQLIVDDLARRALAQDE